MICVEAVPYPTKNFIRVCICTIPAFGFVGFVQCRNTLFPVHNYRARNVVNNSLSDHLATRSRYQQSITYKTVGIRNLIPLDIRQSNSLSKLKKNLTRHVC